MVFCLGKPQIRRKAEPPDTCMLHWYMGRLKHENFGSRLRQQTANIRSDIVRYCYSNRSPFLRKTDSSSDLRIGILILLILLILLSIVPISPSASSCGVTGQPKSPKRHNLGTPHPCS